MTEPINYFKFGTCLRFLPPSTLSLSLWWWLAIDFFLWNAFGDLVKLASWVICCGAFPTDFFFVVVTFLGYFGLVGEMNSLCFCVNVVPSGRVVFITVVRCNTPFLSYWSLTSSKIRVFFFLLFGCFVSLRKNGLSNWNFGGGGKFSLVECFLFWVDGLVVRQSYPRSRQLDCPSQWSLSSSSPVLFLLVLDVELLLLLDLLLRIVFFDGNVTNFGGIDWSWLSLRKGGPEIKIVFVGRQLRGAERIANGGMNYLGWSVLISNSFYYYVRKKKSFLFSAISLILIRSCRGHPWIMDQVLGWSLFRSWCGRQPANFTGLNLVADKS